MANYVEIAKMLTPQSKIVAELKRILPSHIKADYVARTFLTQLKYNPALAECTEETLLKSLMKASELGLPIDGRMASLIPFKQWKKKENITIHNATLVVGYQGMIKLMYQSGDIASYNALAVHENDFFDVDYGSVNPLVFKPLLDGDRGAVKGFVSIAWLKGSDAPSIKYMPKSECLEIGEKHSPTYKKELPQWIRDASPWAKNNSQDAMCLKTVVRQHSKFLPMSVQALSHMSDDGGIVIDMEDEVPDFVKQPEDDMVNIVTKEAPIIEDAKVINVPQPEPVKARAPQPKPAQKYIMLEDMLDDSISELDNEDGELFDPLINEAEKIKNLFSVKSTIREVIDLLNSPKASEINKKYPELYLQIEEEAQKREQELKASL